MRLPTRIRSLVVVACISACSNGTEPTAIDTSPDVTPRRIAAGDWSACALNASGKTYCWGVNGSWYEFGFKQVGLPAGAAVLTPVPDLVSLSAGATLHTCGLAPSRDIICWGRGGSGQLARGVVEATGNVPEKINLSASWAGVNVGRLTSCGWTTDGTGYCWGLDQKGELGDPATVPLTKVLTPRAVTGGIKFASIVPGWQHTCGIATTGTAYCWGMNVNGQLGIGAIDSINHPTPAVVSQTLKFRKLALGMQSTCGIATTSEIYCWGYNAVGQLGDGTTTTRAAPTLVASSKKFTDVAIGNASGGTFSGNVIYPSGLAQGGVTSACAIADDKTAWCWGWNGGGQLGDGTVQTRLSPVAVSGGLQLTSISVGGGFACATGTTKVYCWGANGVGQLGTSVFIDSEIPIAVNLAWP